MKTPQPHRRARPAKARSSLGPIGDLEAHLPEDWWSKLFNALYVKTDGDVVENAENTARDIDMVVKLTGIQAHNQILDLCCGQGRHSLELARRGFRNVTGVDRSRYLVRLARKRAEDQRLPVAFKEGDARNLRLPDDSLDCVIVMGNSFGYFANEEDDHKVLKAIGRCLRASGTLMLDITEGEWIRKSFDPRSWEWIDANHFVCRERSLSSDGDRLVSREVIVHDERGVIADQLYAERLYSRERITAALERAGFRNVRFHGTVEALSDRGQDLGMMAKRMVLTADAPRKVQVAPRRQPVLDVAVMLGDPRLPDTVKRGGQFNPEDIQTVERLKDALSEVPGFRFRYLDNHATMERDLDAARTDLVFNLCDEGWNNDAFKELHVPAWLEMKGYPYTGAGPACLAACYDKALVRAVATSVDVPVPLETYVRAGDQGATLPSVFPAILKPNFGDSSIGITARSVVTNEQEFLEALQRLRTEFADRPLLVQEYLTGGEFSVCLVGNPSQGLRSLPVLEVDYSRLDPSLPRILGYESKWEPDSPYWTSVQYGETRLSEADQARMIDYSMRLFERLRCRDYARFDFRAGANGEIKLLEVNPNPGWCWDGKVNLMAGFAGIRYAELLGMILAAARDRAGLTVQNPAREPVREAARA
jgi:D-alanine-D-alanine ligase